MNLKTIMMSKEALESRRVKVKIIESLHKSSVICACGCSEELPKGDSVCKIDGKYFKLHHGRIYRLHVAGMRFIRGIVNGKSYT